MEEILDWTIGRTERGLYFSATTKMIFIMPLMLPSEMSGKNNAYVKSVCYVVTHCNHTRIIIIMGTTD